MDSFKDSYGILALAAAKELKKEEKDFDKGDFIGALEIVLQSVKAKIFAKKDDYKLEDRY